MKIYSHYGFHEFVIILGYKGYIIKEYFANYFLHQKVFDYISEGDATIFESTSLENCFEPEIVFHLAAQPLVRYSYREPKETFEVNRKTHHTLVASARAGNVIGGGDSSGAGCCAFRCKRGESCYPFSSRDPSVAACT